MPLFQYSCKQCGAESEILVRGTEAPACPKCGSTKLEKQLSAFNAVSGKPSMPMAPCGAAKCCSGQACGLN
ncbi:MAG: zinc ribbon domain-containing protein [FCB group bacterium]|jgi:putative FmdB family regulatory protein|nr:zinc ribbon domain-containing protein [FCB group bacterium]